MKYLKSAHLSLVAVIQILASCIYSTLHHLMVWHTSHVQYSNRTTGTAPLFMKAYPNVPNSSMDA